ncbi:DNA-J related domain-containing protein [Alkalimonas amylolytica]|uniref:DnaJ domain-containing protein n=1 Tax=Alkalimonas amylolytica TaxID=152573 RepID=A0A1H3X329_ALKAM|nr:DNA-J related domain-containing protein [Alkalimonas amylolytica]SDZ93391.1 DnaJ domain-containing protein [Alkalimonas amylolytica]
MQAPLPTPQLHLLQGQLETILLQSSGIVTEQQLLQRLGLQLTNAPSDPHYALFQRHFVLQHLLYRIQKQWLLDEVAWLDIGLAKVELLPYLAQQLSAQDQGRAQYYLDWANFYQMDADTLAQQLEDFWQQFASRTVVSVPEFSRQQACTLLQLSWPCDLALLKRQYRSLALKHHPDRGGDAEHFVRIRQAYQQLRAELR